MSTADRSNLSGLAGPIPQAVGRQVLNPAFCRRVSGSLFPDAEAVKSDEKRGMSRHCFSIPQNATVRISGAPESVDADAFDALSKAVSMVQGSMQMITGDPSECTVEVPDDDAAQSAFRLMASEVLQKFEFTCHD